MSIKIHLSFKVTKKPKKNNKKYNKDYIRLLGLMQTIRGTQGRPLTGKQGQRDFESERKTIMDYRQTKHSQILPGNYLLL